MKYPDNYEEAKKVIKECINDQEYNNYFLKKNRLRSGLVAGVFLALAAVLGVGTNDMGVALGTLPLVGFTTFSSLLPLLHQKSLMKNIDSGKYFENKSEQELMEKANIFVTTYNSWLARKEEESNAKCR